MLEQLYEIMGYNFGSVAIEILFTMCMMMVLLLCDRFFSIVEYVIHIFGGKH